MGFKKGCENCEHCERMGNGEYVCFECGEEMPVWVIENGKTTPDYMACNGRKWELDR